MGIMNDIQAIGKILQKAGNIKLYEQLLAIQEKTLETMEENKNLKEEIEKLKEKLRIKDSVIFKHDACWIKDKNGKVKDGPFCSKCYESSEKLIHLIGCLNPSYSMCPQCNITLPIKFGKPWKQEPFIKGDESNDEDF